MLVIIGIHEARKTVVAGRELSCTASVERLIHPPRRSEQEVYWGRSATNWSLVDDVVGDSVIKA
jgi:hypothetical protein